MSSVLQITAVFLISLAFFAGIQIGHMSSMMQSAPNLLMMFIPMMQSQCHRMIFLSTGGLLCRSKSAQIWITMLLACMPVALRLDDRKRHPIGKTVRRWYINLYAAATIV